MAEVTRLLVTGEAGTRRYPTIWSPLEYACHLRDVMLIQSERILLALRMDRPRAFNMGRDDRAALDGYADQDPNDVARQLTDATAMYTHLIKRLDQADWDRTLIHGNSDSDERPLRWTAAQAHHEVVHHLLDIQRQLS